MLKPTKNIFFSLKVALTAILIALSSAAAYASDIWSSEREKAKSIITTEKLAREVSFLADSICQGRATGTKGAAEAAMWVRRKFQDAGLVDMTGTWTQGFKVNPGHNGRNVIGMLPGSRSIPCDRYIIVGAHYDHLGTIKGTMYPGADSNASGTAALLSLAEMFATTKMNGKMWNSNIIFVAFDANGHDLAGSQALWNMIERGELTDPVSGGRITKQMISLMVNIDQVGCTMSPLASGRKDYMIMLGNHSLKPSAQEMIGFCNRIYAIDMEIDLTYYGSKNFTKMFYRLSDQRVFIDNGIPAVLFTSGITMNTNKTRDTAQTIDLEILRKRIFLMYHWLEKML